MSSTRSKRTTRAVARSNGSSSTNRRMIEPSVAFDDRLAGAREAVRVLGVDDRPRLVEAVEDHAGVVRRRALLGRAADAEVAVADGEHRLARGARRLEPALDDPSSRRRRCCASARRAASRALMRTSSPRSSTTMSAPAARSSAGAAPRATPITSPKSPRAARGDAGERVLDHDGAARASRRRRDGRLEEAVGRGLAAQPEAPDVAAVDGQLEQVRRCPRRAARRGSSRSRTRRRCARRRRAAARPSAPSRGTASTPSSASARSTSACLWSPMRAHRLGRGVDAARAQEVAHAVLARLAVDVGEVVALDVERARRAPPRTSASSTRRAARWSRSGRRRGRRGPRRRSGSCAELARQRAPAHQGASPISHPDLGAAPAPRRLSARRDPRARARARALAGPRSRTRSRARAPCRRRACAERVAARPG